MNAYPNREHETADKAARRRALSDLRTIIEDAQTLVRRIESGYEPHGEDADRFASTAVKLAANLARLETLRDAREWHAADVAEAQDSPERDLIRGLASMSPDRINPTSQIAGLIHAARELMPDAEADQ